MMRAKIYDSNTKISGLFSSAFPFKAVPFDSQFKSRFFSVILASSRIDLSIELQKSIRAFSLGSISLMLASSKLNWVVVSFSFDSFLYCLRCSWYLDVVNLLLKLMSTIFYQIFISHQMIVLQNCEKCFLFHLKSSFRSRDIQIFVFSSSPLFSLSAIASEVDRR